MKKKKAGLTIAGKKIGPGEFVDLDLPVAALYDYTEISIPLRVIRGNEDGPKLFISAAIHGDEILGTEVIKRLLKIPEINNIHGTLILAPIVNVFGYNSKSRYLPDRRDLNRSFPGNKNGSMASRIAWTFMKEVVKNCTHGIDLHTGAIHRTNLPQIRACLSDKETKTLARAFGVPVILDSTTRDGSLREAARRKKIPMLLFEGGEALRFDEDIISVALNGCLSVMRSIGMLQNYNDIGSNENLSPEKTFVAKGSFWVRAPHSGSIDMHVELGDRVEKQQVLAKISNPFGEEEFEVISPEKGILVGKTQIPLVNKGDAVFHIAAFENTKKVKSGIDELEADSIMT